MNFVSVLTVGFVVGAVASGAVFLLMKRTAAAPAPVSAGNVYTLEYGWSFPAIGYASIASAVFYAIAAWLNGMPQPGDGWIVVGLVAGFGGGGACMLNDVRRRVHLSREGIEVLSPWSGTIRLPWSEVSSVAYSRMAHQFTIRGRSGQKVRLSRGLVGMPTFVQHLRQCLPPAVYAEALDRYAQEGGHV
jgi:hypothetical protein